MEKETGGSKIQGQQEQYSKSLRLKTNKGLGVEFSARALAEMQGPGFYPQDKKKMGKTGRNFLCKQSLHHVYLPLGSPDMQRKR